MSEQLYKHLTPVIYCERSACQRALNADVTVRTRLQAMKEAIGARTTCQHSGRPRSHPRRLPLDGPQRVLRQPSPRRAAPPPHSRVAPLSFPVSSAEEASGSSRHADEKRLEREERHTDCGRRRGWLCFERYERALELKLLSSDGTAGRSSSCPFARCSSGCFASAPRCKSATDAAAGANRLNWNACDQQVDGAHPLVSVADSGPPLAPNRFSADGLVPFEDIDSAIDQIFGCCSLPTGVQFIRAH